MAFSSRSGDTPPPAPETDGTRSKPRILARHEVARSRLFAIESLELRFANGAERTFERLTGSGNGHGGGAVMIVAMPDPDHVLLIHEYAAGFDDYALTLPKGLVDPGEDVVSAANRELMEECGVGARHIEPLVELSLAPNYMSHRMHVMLATDLYEKRLPGDEPEPLIVERYPLEDINGLLAREDFHEGRAIAALFIARDRMRSERVDDAWW
ncbi:MULTISPECIES: ADP compounds hydrolase NudE [Chromohalobacter]|uniref:ADP compounds hydrolase NudE n=1 Tax=Chromohalobacter TaxID=42054 RepID=UPI00054F500E|nr:MULTISPECIES: ADP compounds hydrolase NudE [Chromohalobacter]MDF9435334.1 ADP compounds hydrolase NudE [Chromohalobacter israelensis]MDO0945809.1 ADP compounds hydrolase NudE [Chromohalobacter salexigens]NQY44966.1 ADP compounds hydrolase NudE [Chromohalobacter sp.]NWO56185.1 ADP compounds hydrolase NudE [Chromohalobacter salexigens]